MEFGEVFSLVTFVVGIILLLPLLVGGVFLVVVVANRADPDPSGQRPAAVYAFATSFLTLFVALFATTALVAALCQLIGSHGSGMPRAYADYEGIDATAFAFDGHQHPLGDAVARGAVLSGLIALVAGLVFFLHVRAAKRVSDGLPSVDPVARARSSYIAAVSFVCVTLIVVSAVVVLYDIFRGIAPGVFTSSGTGSSEDVLRSLIPAVYLAVASLVILAAHLRYAPPPFRPGVFSRWYGGPPAPAAEPVAEPVTEAVVAPATPEVLASPPRKRAPRKTTGGP
jgi:hypothetical protein